MSPPPRLRLRARSGLVWRTWDHESVVFNSDSGQTHLLDLVSREALTCLQGAALDVGELSDRMAERLDIDNNDELRLYVERLVSQFDELGLIDTESSAS